MNVLVLRPDRGSRSKPRDYATVFRPESEGFAEVAAKRGLSVEVVEVDLGAPLVRRAEQFLDAVDGAVKGVHTLTHVAWFGHGLPRSLPQVGVSPDEFAAHLASPKRPSPTVALYSCLNADGGVGGDGGYADLLRDALCRSGSAWCRVVGHALKGHAGWNPTLREFLGLGSESGGVGGTWVVAPKTRLWPAFVRLMKETDLRWRVPFMTAAEVHAELEAK